MASRPNYIPANISLQSYYPENGLIFCTTDLRAPTIMIYRNGVMDWGTQLTAPSLGDRIESKLKLCSVYFFH